MRPPETPILTPERLVATLFQSPAGEKVVTQGRDKVAAMRRAMDGMLIVDLGFGQQAIEIIGVFSRKFQIASDADLKFAMSSAAGSLTDFKSETSQAQGMPMFFRIRNSF